MGGLEYQGFPDFELGKSPYSACNDQSLDRFFPSVIILIETIEAPILQNLP